MSAGTTTDGHRIDIDLVDDLGADLDPAVPRRATLELRYEEDGGRTVELTHGQDEWTLVFSEEGECIDRDPVARPMPGWVGEAVELVKHEIR